MSVLYPYLISYESLYDSTSHRPRENIIDITIIIVLICVMCLQLKEEGSTPASQCTKKLKVEL